MERSPELMMALPSLEQSMVELWMEAKPPFKLTASLSDLNVEYSIPMLESSSLP
ncbi:hypothetical protein [Methanobrevibacter sp.]|uniref:hypothetical protein n=1 Tax=Methanobrevibacter sp. TaxID=66852 RepID=UPI00386E5B40